MRGPQLDAIIEALVDGGVGFVVIGGLAVGWHGFIRATKDIDIVPDPDPANIARLVEVLERIGARVGGFTDFDPAQLPSPLDAEVMATGGNWVLETDLGRLDILQALGDRELWDYLDAGAVEGDLLGRRVRFCGYEQLLELKREADRPQDRLDIEQLRTAREPEPPDRDGT